ncbi:MAG: type IX secretion system membrane protein PorP/SprF [Sphingobacteriales bacterium]|nr:MAG: type IX secretion system membrane protein PorP/SprF [Sphingobacteriales bacterium]
MKRTFTRFAMIACFTSGLFNNECAGQDVHFSQFFESPLYRNPALSGIFTGDIRVQAIFRDQWNSVTNAYKTGSLNAEYKTPIGQADDFLTIGMLALHDRAGTIGWTTVQFLPALTYHKSLSADYNRYLSVGFMGGWVQKNFDRSKMTTNSTYEGIGDGEPLANTSYSYLDGSAGISYNATIRDNPDDNLYLGIAYHHFARPNQSFYRDPAIELNPKWVFSGGVRFGISEYAYLTMQADHSRQGSFTESVAGAMVGMKLGPDPENPPYVLHAGAYFRLNDALIPVVKLDYFPFSFAFSYDVNVSRLRTSSYGRGGMELSLSFVKSLDRDNASLNAVRCPRF